MTAPSCRCLACSELRAPYTALDLAEVIAAHSTTETPAAICDAASAVLKAAREADEACAREWQAPGGDMRAFMSPPSSAPMVVIGPEQIGGPLPTKVACNRCGGSHDIIDSVPSGVQAYRCGEALYLAGIKGREVLR